MKTYIINLERSTERRRQIEAEVKKHRLDYVFVEAVDGAKLTESELSELCDQKAVKKYSDWLTKSALGCALSHLRAYQKMIEDGENIALILEDDVILPDNINTLLDEIAGHLSGKKVVLLYYQSLTELSLSRSSATNLSNNFQILYPLTLDGLTSAAAYAITKDAAQALADFILPVRFTSDSWNCFISENILSTVRVVYPRTVLTTNAKSTVSVIAQSGLRARLTTLIDDKKIPLLFQAFRFLRRKSIKAQSKFALTNETSPFQQSNSVDED